MYRRWCKGLQYICMAAQIPMEHRGGSVRATMHRWQFSGRCTGGSSGGTARVRVGVGTKDRGVSVWHCKRLWGTEAKGKRPRFTGGSAGGCRRYHHSVCKARGGPGLQRCQG